jgi:hypothetical protein
MQNFARFLLSSIILDHFRNPAVPSHPQNFQLPQAALRRILFCVSAIAKKQFKNVVAVVLVPGVGQKGQVGRGLR